MATFIGGITPNFGTPSFAPTQNFAVPGFGSAPSFDPQTLMGLLAALGQAIQQMSSGWNGFLANPQSAGQSSAPSPGPISFGAPQVAPFGFGNTSNAGNAGGAGSAYASASSYSAPTPAYSAPVAAVTNYSAPTPAPAVAVAAPPPPAAAGGAGAYG